MRRPPKQTIIDALNKSYGVKTTAAKILGTSRVSLDAWIDSLELQDDLERSRSYLVDLAQNVIVEKIQAGDYAAAKYVLSCFAGSEWSEKAKNEEATRKVIINLGEGVEPVRPLVIWPEDEDDVPDNPDKAAQ